MAHEIFPNPTLESVHFEIRFPALFYLNQKIGNFQTRIMDDFPKSSQIFQQEFIMGPDNKPQPQDRAIVWRFENITEKTRIDVKMDRLTISSFEYKTYENPDAPEFKKIIIKVINNFLKEISIPNFSRLGFRYIDHCPLEEKTTSYFNNYYNPLFDIDQFSIEEILEYGQIFRLKRENYFLTFRCGINKVNNEDKYIMDFDGYAENIDSKNYITTTDALQEIIYQTYDKNITENLKNRMRGITRE